jgi:hypothetical protein
MSDDPDLKGTVPFFYRGGFYMDNQGTSVHLAKLEERVSGLEIGVRSILAKLDDKAKLPWPAYTLAVTVIIALGAMAYWPVRESTLDIKSEIKELKASIVPRGEHERVWADERQSYRDIKEEFHSIRKDYLGKDEAAVFAKMRDQQYAELDRRVERLEKTGK